MRENLLISIEYKLAGDIDSRKLALKPDEYFEPIDDEALDSDLKEEFDYDSVPKYFHGLDYIQYNSGEVEYTKITMIDSSKNIKYIQSEVFWNNGENRVILTQAPGSNISECEVLVETLIQEEPKTIQHVKFAISESIPKYQSQIVIQQNKDGSEMILIDM